MDRSIGQRSFDGGRSDCSSVAGSTRSYGSSIPLFLASELNAKQYREKKAQANELDALKAEIARQQRDIVLLRRQIQTRNVQIEEVTEELNDCTVESLRNSFDMDSSRDSPSIDGSSIGSGFSHRSSAASLERLTRLSTPLSTRTRQKAEANCGPKSHLDWVIHNAKQTPGPASYGSPRGSGTQLVGGKFSSGHAKSALELAIHNAMQTPGPSEYRPESSGGSLSGGKISPSKSKSSLDWVIHNAKLSPGPGQYTIPQQQTIAGAFSTAKPKSDLDLTILRAGQIPGPGEYLPVNQNVLSTAPRRTSGNSPLASAFAHHMCS